LKIKTDFLDLSLTVSQAYSSSNVEPNLYFFVEFRECFYLNARNGGVIRTLDELSLIMRSLGMSPTIAELRKYLKDKGIIIDIHFKYCNQYKVNNFLITNS